MVFFLLAQYVDGDKVVRLCRDTGDSVTVNASDFQSDLLRKLQDAKVQRGVTTRGKYVCTYEYGDKQTVSLYKMNEEANSIKLCYQIDLKYPADCPDAQDFFEIGFDLGCSDGTEYFLNSRINQETNLHLINVGKGEQIWQKTCTRDEHVFTYRLGNGFVALLKCGEKSPSLWKWTLEILELSSGETLSCHELHPSNQWYEEIHLKVQEKVIIVAFPPEWDQECFECFLMDAAHPTKEPKKIIVQVPAHYWILSGIGFHRQSHLTFCLEGTDTRLGNCTLVFVVFDLEKKVEARRVFLSNVDCIGPVDELFLLRQLCDEKEENEEKTKFMLCGFNRSLKMLNSGLFGEHA